MEIEVEKDRELLIRNEIGLKICGNHKSFKMLDRKELLNG